MVTLFFKTFPSVISAHNIIRTLLTAVLCASMAMSQLSHAASSNNHNSSPEQRTIMLHSALTNLNSGNPKQDKEHIAYLSNFEYREVEEGIALRLHQEVTKGEHQGARKINLAIVQTCLAALGAMGTSHTSDIVFDALERAEELLKEDQAYEVLRDQWMKAYEKMDEREKRLPRLPFFFFAPETPEEGVEHVEKIQEALESRILGQPEVVDYMADLAMKDLVYLGQREVPELLLLMGSPGTGKDTAAEAYVDARYGYEKAYEEHMFRLPILKDKNDLWGVVGSTTGHIGSDNFPPFFKFLVEHSGGRYKLGEKTDARGDVEYFIYENPEWEPGKVIEGTIPPEMAVVFVNEFHNWSKSVKDQFLKQAVEKGYFQINNPNGGLSEIYVPVTFVIATNEGLSLVTSRENNGERYGEPLTYEQMLEKWENVHDDIPALRAQLQKTNGAKNSSGGRDAPGISEELLNRIPDRAFKLLRPLSPENLRKIVDLKMKNAARKLKNKTGLLGELELEWSEELLHFLQSHHYVAEENARPMADRVAGLVEQTLLQAVRSRELGSEAQGQKIVLDVHKNEDKTTNLTFSVRDKESDEELQSFTRLIKATEADREKPVISDEKLADLAQLAEKIKKQVFGVDHVAERLAEAILVTEEARHAKVTVDTAKEPARVLAFFGLSSTGKTEVTKVLAETLFGKRTAQKTIDFGQVRSVQDLKNKILGDKDATGESIPSEFMKEYDRTNGNVIFVFDEIANAPKEALKALYDILREPVVTFSDGKARVMSGVTIILTGNAGEEWYQEIPRNVPEDIQRTAMDEVYKQAMLNPHMQRHLLEKYFSEAFLNRIGLRNTFFFPPLNFKATRELTQLKVMRSIQGFEPQEGQRGWHIQFASEDIFVELMEAIEEHGFILREQGASLDRFVKQDLFRQLRLKLLRANAPSGGKVTITGVEELAPTLDEDDDEPHPHVLVHAEVEGLDEPVTVNMKGKAKIEEPVTSDEDRLITAFHEAGHEVVRTTLMGDRIKPTYLSIIPGVGQIANRWIYYLGVSKAKETGEIMMTRQAVIADMAVKAAGEVGQTLVTKGERHDAGKHDDMARATDMAHKAILRWGLSEAWGRMTIPPEQKMSEYLSTLSESRRQLFEQEVQAMLDEARALAQHVLELNFQEVFVPLALELAEKGIMKRDDFEAFYDNHLPIHPEDRSWQNRRYNPNRNKPWWKRMLESMRGSNTEPRDAELFEEIPRPERIARLEEIVLAKKSHQVGQVSLPEDLPLATDSGKDNCADLLEE